MKKSGSLNRIKYPLKTSIFMIAGYARARIVEQIRAVAFIIVYLLLFQMVILQIPPAGALMLATGIAFMVSGLAFFLEGLLLGLMPLGEQVGLRLPEKFGLPVILFFSFLIGFGATLAEPSFAALKTAGKDVTAWSTPLLYLLLEKYSSLLMISIGVGVGIAVALGMIRFYYGFSIKPFILILLPVLLAASLYASFDSNLEAVLGLSWDTGAVTTGPVTVPLVLALGMGVSRAAGKKNRGGGGFGIVMLASALPVISALFLAFLLSFSVHSPVSEREFFSPAFREQARSLFSEDEDLLRYAFTEGSEQGRLSWFETAEEYEKALQSLINDPVERKKMISDIPLEIWVARYASEREARIMGFSNAGSAPPHSSETFPEIIAREGRAALQAIIPLVLLLLITLTVFLKNRPRYIDEFLLGCLFALIGMTLLTTGIQTGLAPLGDNVGRQLPRVFSAEEKDIGRILIRDFNPDIVFDSIAPDGIRKQFFYLHEGNDLNLIEFIPEQYDVRSRTYEHRVKKPPLFSSDLTILGIALVFLFAFGLGYGSTLAEPALQALGKTVEELSVGTIRKSGIVTAVSIGVGIGLMLGVGRIIFGIPILWLILPPYLLLLPLTMISSEDFAGIAWDCGGVTTGPVTVPLVLAMGLGIGGELGVMEGFGVLSLASVFPVLTVMLYGLHVRSKQRRSMLIIRREENHG